MLVFGILFLLPLATAQARNVCPDPAYIMTPKSDLLRLHLAFNYNPPVSRRFLNEVHYYEPADPHLTVGMGHWIDDKLARLFQRLKQDMATWEEMTADWADSMDAWMWEEFERDSGESGRNAEAISRGLTVLLCADDASSQCVREKLVPWTHATKERFNEATHWFRAGWLKVSVHSRVAEHQIHHWAESVVNNGQVEAAKRQVATLGGIASVASATSSGLRSTMFPPGAQSVEARSSRLGVSASWLLDSVPESVLPPAGSTDDPRLLEDWKSLVAWQFYTVRKAKKNRIVRGRMKAIWQLFYEQSWGPLPAELTFSDVTESRRHSGCYMARGSFDTTSPVRIRATLDCTAPLPTPTPAPCVTAP